MNSPKAKRIYDSQSDELSLGSLEYLMQYFELHAKQRVTTFNFFLIISGFVLVALDNAVRVSRQFPVGIMLGLALLVVAFVFWKLDERIKFLIRHCEQILIQAEESIGYGSFGVFSTEPRKFKEHRKKTGIIRGAWTFSEAFNVAFFLVALFGMVSVVYCLLYQFGVLL